MTNRDYYLEQLGITRFEQKQLLEKPLPETKKILPGWSNLQQCVATCTACELHKTRTQTVFGAGNLKAHVMFIGEAPGAEEDRQGKPFVGRAGKLLTEMLRALSLSREDVYIANVLKCRPPKNRDPLPQEVKQCTPFLQQQIAFIRPKLLVALGRIAAQYLLQCHTPLTRLRGQLFHYGDTKTPLLVTFHPAYLLRTPVEKAKAYHDLLAIQKLIQKEITDAI